MQKPSAHRVMQCGKNKYKFIYRSIKVDVILAEHFESSSYICRV